MLRILVESRRRSTRRQLAIAVSAVAHVTLLNVLVMSRPTRTADATEPVPTRVVYFPPQTPSDPQPARPRAAGPIALPLVPVAQVLEIAALPVPSLQISVARGAVIDASALHQPNVSSSFPSRDSVTTEVLSEHSVDLPVAMLSGQQPPLYPPLLERAGVRGDVTAQFIVDTTGRVERQSIVILQTSHDDFARAVERRLIHLRFTPARAGGRAVRQLVQQRFSFEVVRR